LATKSKWSQEIRLMAVQLIFFINRNNFIVERLVIKEIGNPENWNFSNEQMRQICFSNEESQNSLVQIITKGFGI